MQGIAVFTDYLATYHSLTAFLGSFFFGEGFIITATLFYLRFQFSLAQLFLLTLAGTIAADVVWFFAGRTLSYAHHFFERRIAKHARVFTALEKTFGERPFVALLYIKFLYGTRILTVLYLSFRRIPFRYFLLYDLVGSSIWLAVVILIGFLAGKGIANLLPAFNAIGYILVGLLIALFVAKALSLWLTKNIQKE